MTFEQLFNAAAGEDLCPYEWQKNLALRVRPATAIIAPTGSGKTEAVLLDWLWRRGFQRDESARRLTPRRLVLALPMRTLVEQTLDRIEGCISRLADAAVLTEPVKIYGLMGGAADDSWVLEPTADAVLVGTIDMLLSRALNRGYGRGRASWPVDFGLVNNDCRWVFDEVQLMDAAVATSAQLAGFRTALGTGAPCETVWMSATLDRSWLETRDHPAIEDDEIVSVGAADRDPSTPLGARIYAAKTLVRRDTALGDTNPLATTALDEHDASGGRLTLLILNRVDAAVAAYDALKKDRRAAGVDLVLLHSRFRPPDRKRALARLAEPLPPGGRIVVSTQVIEAGVDLDASALVTDLAPWASMVQRAGRLNRTGAQGDTRLVWIDPGESALAHGKSARPYEGDDLLRARGALLELDGMSFSPQAIDEFVGVKSPGGASSALLGERPLSVLLRRPDIVDLFDTDPTLDGDDPDIGRFIRLGDDLDVAVAWRELGPSGPAEGDPLPSHEEVCAVPLWQAKDSVNDLAPWRWHYARRKWERVRRSRDVLPGDLLLLDCSTGAYDAERGWTGRKGTRVDPIPADGDAERAEGDADDPLSVRPKGRWITLEKHTANVVAALEKALGRLDLDARHAEALRLAARVHDAGKAHSEFQERLVAWAGEAAPGPGLWAKAPSNVPVVRPVFRHELASALLLLERHARSRDVDLAAFLVAAHHGKLRLTPRVVPDDTGLQVVACLGVRQGDELPQVVLNGTRVGPLTVDLSILALGSLSEATWAERALDLLDELGPFRLAYLEALLRAADQRASREEALA